MLHLCPQHGAFSAPTSERRFALRSWDGMEEKETRQAREPTR